MKKLVLISIFISMLYLCLGQAISQDYARQIAKAFLSQKGYTPSGYTNIHPIADDSRLYAYIFELDPQGYIVVSADEKLPPVIAYSFDSVYLAEDSRNPMQAMLLADLAQRILAPESIAQRNRQARQDLLSGANRGVFEQWPPEGSTFTGGWVKTRWNQTAPYNALCPIDPVSQIRSVAGCPAVAMAQIFNYHQQLNGTTFTDTDDYYHNYSGRYYWIDNDYDANGFPSWPQLNDYLDTLANTYWVGTEPAPLDIAALIFACGAAAHQVYSSQGSGTFAVSQAFSAIQRFGYAESELLTADSPDLFTRIAQNIKDALPVLYACVTPAWDAGHNVVLDGYNTDDYYHINFGWGGSYDGWFLLPSEMPYQLTVVEGAVVDIIPPQFLFCMPEQIVFENITQLSEGVDFELLNLSDQPLLIEAVECPHYNSLYFQVTIQNQSLPYLLPAGQSLYGTLQGIFLDRVYQGFGMRIKHSKGYQIYPVVIDDSIPLTNDDPQVSPPAISLRSYPNPFQTSLQIELTGKVPAAGLVEIYNIKGQLVRELAANSSILLWDGKALDGRDLPRGIYLLHLKGTDSTARIFKQ